jgi:hypothetical protein
VHDFHHAVCCGGEVLDATWPDALAPHGFRVNSSWTAGSGDTLLAVPDDAVYQAFGAVADGQLSDLKATLVVRCMHTTPLSLLSLGRILSEPNKRYDFDGGAGHTTARGGGEACGLFQRVADVAWRATKVMRGRDEDASMRRPGLATLGHAHFAAVSWPSCRPLRMAEPVLPPPNQCQGKQMVRCFDFQWSVHL